MTSILQRPRTETLSCAQAVIRFLAAQQTTLFDGTLCPLFGGVAGIFGHGNVAGIGEALENAELPYIRGHNEQGLAHMAIAFAKAQRGRRVMAVTTSIGPGATNLVTAAALAHTNRLPVLFLPGDSYASRRPDPVLQQLEDPNCPYLSVNDCLRPVSRLFDRISRPEQLVDVLPRVVEVLLDPARRGPVTLCLPQDVQAEAWDFPLDLFEPRVHGLRRQPPDVQELSAAARLLNEADFPLIIAGGGVHYSGAEEDLRLFAEDAGIPVCETQAGKGALPWDHPLNLGAVGVTGTAAANQAAARADCVLCVGTRLSDFTTASKSLFHKRGVPLIGLNTVVFDAYKGQAQPLVADAAVGLDSLRLALHPRDRSAYRAHIESLRQEWHKTRQELTQPSSDLPSDCQVVAAVGELAGPRDVVVAAAGGLPGELHKFWQVSDPVGYHVEYGYSCMGYEIAGGLGVKLGLPDREVYVMLGDGSYLMMHSELLTAVQMGKKLNVILLDNHGFGCINRLQKACGGAAYGNLFDGPQVDFVQNAQSYGCHARAVSSIEELKVELQANRARKESCVTVIRTDPNAASPGFAWWDVAVAEHSESASVNEARRDYQGRVQRLKGGPQ